MLDSDSDDEPLQPLQPLLQEYQDAPLQPLLQEYQDAPLQPLPTGSQEAFEPLYTGPPEALSEGFSASSAAPQSITRKRMFGDDEPTESASASFPGPESASAFFPAPVKQKQGQRQKRPVFTKQDFERFLRGEIEQSELPPGTKVKRLHKFLRNLTSGTYKRGKIPNRVRVHRRVKPAKTKEYKQIQAAETRRVLNMRPEDMNPQERRRANNVTRLLGKTEGILQSLRDEGVENPTLSDAYHHKWKGPIPPRIRRYFQERGRQTRFKKKQAGLIKILPERLRNLDYQQRSSLLKGVLQKGWRGHPRGYYLRLDENGNVMEKSNGEPYKIKIDNRQVPWTRHTPPQITAKTPRTKTLMQIAAIAAGAPVDSTQKCARLVMSAGKVPRETNENDAARKNTMKQLYEQIRYVKYQEYVQQPGNVLPENLQNLDPAQVTEYATMPVRQYKTKRPAWHVFHLQDKAAVRRGERPKTLRDALKFSLKDTQEIMRGTMNRFKEGGQLANPLTRALNKAMKDARKASSQGRLDNDTAQRIIQELTQQPIDVTGRPGSPTGGVRGYGKKDINLRTGRVIKPQMSRPVSVKFEQSGQDDGPASMEIDEEHKPMFIKSEEEAAETEDEDEPMFIKSEEEAAETEDEDDEDGPIGIPSLEAIQRESIQPAKRMSSTDLEDLRTDDVQKDYEDDQNMNNPPDTKLKKQKTQGAQGVQKKQKTQRKRKKGKRD